MKERNFRDEIFVVRHLIQYANEMKDGLSLCFVDVQKVFDCISRGMMEKNLEAFRSTRVVAEVGKRYT